MDPITRLFGVNGGANTDGYVDIGTGALRGFPELGRLWEDLTVEEILADIGHYPGTQGPQACLIALSELWRLELRREVDPECFVLTHGALDALGHAIACVPPEAAVIFPEPGFGFGIAVERMGRCPVPVHWPPGESTADYLSKVRDNLKGLRVPSAVIASFPANPSGTCATSQELAELAATADEFGALLIIDDVYRFLHAPSVPLDLPNLIVVDSLSKRFGAPGLRFGYAMTAGAHLSNLRASIARTSVGVGLPTAAIATKALRRYCDDPSIHVGVVSELERRRASIRAAVSDRVLPQLVLTEHGLYGCLRLPPGGDPQDVCARARENGIVVTASDSLQSRARSNGHSAFVRFCIGSDPRVGPAVGVLSDEVERILETEASRTAT
jgi:aspartate/methionine/tyrosine aminotransferase